MPQRFVRAVAPAVTHGLQEMAVEGASLEHTLLEVALMGALIGAGMAPSEAVRLVEAQEAQLIGMHRGEALEPGMHPGYAGAGAGKYGKPFGKGMVPQGQMMLPYGKGKAPVQYSKGQAPYMGGKRP